MTDDRKSQDRYGLLAIARSLTDLLDHEAEAMMSTDARKLTSITDRKGSLILRLTTLAKVASEGDVDEDEREALHTLRQRLERNRQLLEATISTTREVTEAMVRIVRSADEDGTYSQAEAVGA